MSGTTQSGTPITALKVASAVAATDKMLGVVENTDGTQEAQQIPVDVLGAAVSDAAGIPAAIQAAENAATTAQAASDASYKNATQAVNDKIGVAGGAAQLDNKAQLMLQGESSLAIIPATAASGATPATPAKLKPLLPLDETATVGNNGDTLGNAISQAAGALQASGGNASEVVVTPTGATASRKMQDITADTPYVQAFSGDNGGAVIQSAVEAIAPGQKLLHFAPGVTVTGDDTDATAAALARVIPRGYGTMANVRERAVYAPHLPYPRTPPKTLRKECLKNTFAALANGETVTGVFAGDSILSVGANIVTPSASPCDIFENAIMSANPTGKFSFQNLAIGGTKWTDLAGSRAPSPWWPNAGNYTTWLAYIIAQAPTFIVLWFGGNDAGSLSVVAMDSVIKSIQTALPNCDIILCTTYLPSFGSTLFGYDTVAYQQAVMYAQQITRTWAAYRNLGLVDVGRWHQMIRDGFDPCDVTLTQVIPDTSTTLIGFGNAITLDSSGTYTFPDVVNDNGVSANACTDFEVTFSMPSAPIAIRFNVSGVNDMEGAPSGNWCYIFFNGTNYTIKMEDGTNAHDPISVESSAPVPSAGPFYFTVCLKNGRLRITTPKPGFVPDENSNIIGAGYVPIFDQLVPRFGGRFTPVIEWLTDSITIWNLCVADSTRFGGGCAEYMPTHTCEDLYAAKPEAGGTGDYHQNAYGVRDGIGPMVNAQDWGLPMVTQVSGISDITAAPTADNYNALLKSLREAGVLAS